MNRYRGLLLAGALLGATVTVPGAPVYAQKDKEKGEPVKVTTADGVELHGMFYQSPKKEAPTVIVLHAIGDRGLQKDYFNLAEALQPYFSVMLFDFRGHGKSKDIDPQKFWVMNKGVKGGPKKTTIELSDIGKDVYSSMVNDIAAVKAFLDRKNDAGGCNTSTTILIGAENGATLGAIWLNSQWYLHRTMPNPNNPLVTMASPNPEGKDVVACVWLSISPKLGTTTVNLYRTLEVPVRGNACPTVFIYGDQDETGKDRAKALAHKLKVADDKKYDFIQPFEVKGNTKLLGIKLVQKSLKTEDAIIDYLQTVVDKKGNEWVKRDFRKTQYLWRSDGVAASYVPAKDPTDDANLRFDRYDRFLMR